ELYDDAIAEYGEILKINPGDPDAILQTAYAYSRQDRMATAAPFLEKALAERPGKSELSLYLAGAYMDLERFKDAEEVLVRGIALSPDRDDLLFTLAVVYEKQVQREKMIAALRKTLDVNPDHADALNYLGYTFADAGEHLDEAVALIQRALRIKPDNGYILDSLAWAYYRKGKTRQALKVMQQAVQQVPDDPIIREHYGDIYLKLSSKDKAREQWKRSLGLDPSNEKLREKFRKADFGDPDLLQPLVKPKGGKKRRQ
ncbi:MAG TPA: hypothetical protein DCS42_02055, partial [Nitrospiraceae bacterium]|nr:hypothetical protein [Nitrospiraceae bacterium]